MIYYRLLRDNKETGPYSEEEMIAKGFKPYDLLWAEGKSAGWQYSSEINAFKKYAPIVEEQPYDRFYKKPVPQKLITEERYTNRTYTPQAQTQSPAVKEIDIIPVQQQQPATARPSYEYNVQAIPGRHIHVTLPSGNTVNLTTLVAKKEVKETSDPAEINNVSAKAESIPFTAEKINTEKKHPSFAETISLPQQPVIKEPKVLTQASALKATDVSHAANQPAYAAANTSFSWTLIAGAVIGIATLVGLGIMIGLSMNHEKNEIAFNEALNKKAKQPPVILSAKPVTVAATPMPAVVTEEPVQHSVSSSSSKNKELVQNAVVKTTLAPENTTKEEKKLLPADKTADNSNNNKPVQGHDVQAQQTKSLSAVNLAAVEKSLSIHSNDFKTGTFGGISGLKCTLFNGSSLALNSVEVEVDYVLASKKIYKTEKLLFKDIPAGAQAVLDAPASTRGIKITSRITKVNPRETALSNTTAKS
ncbi:MAG: hypothetical protein ABJB86_24710 [Bacteroidota bacterium]